MKRRQEIPVLLLLLLGWVLAIWALPSEARRLDRRGEARWKFPLPGNFPGKGPGVGILPSPIIVDPEIKVCWSPLRRLPGCAHSIFKSLSKGKVRLSPECCEAVQGLADHCFKKIFSTIPFKPDFGPLIKEFCAALSDGSGDLPKIAPALK